MHILNAAVQIQTASFWGTVGSIWSKVWPILVAILLFGLVVMIHELGHFIFAKKLGVKVNEFAIGFGPALFKFTKGETQYSIRLLPFGGYCAMEGEDTESESDRSFGKKPVWKRFIIIAAGAVNNLILGFILVAIMIGISGQYGTTQVLRFQEGATSQAAGLQEGDQILKIDGRSTYCSQDVVYMLTNSEDDRVEMVVKRDGEKVDLGEVPFYMEEIEGRRYIDIDFVMLAEKATITRPFAFLKATFLEALSTGRMIWMSLFDMITGRYGLNDIMGPVGVVGAVSSAVTLGIENVLYIMALITINLGIVNLLPLPALDGGRLVFLLVEAIRRKPVPPKYEGWVHAIGLAAFMLLILIITGNDILRFFRQ